MNEHLYDVLVRNQIFVKGRSDDEILTVTTMLAGMIASVGAVMSTSLIGSGASAGALSEVDTLIDYHMGAIGKRIEDDALELADYQVAFIAIALGAMMTKAVVVPTVTRSVVRSSALQLQGNFMTLQGMINAYVVANKRQFSSVVRNGVRTGKSTDAILREMQRVARSRSRQQTTAVVNTAFNHAGDFGRNEVYKANPSFFQGEEWVAILDSRTSAICQSLDGRVFEFNAGPRPPAHYNCRSIRIPIPNERIVKDEYRGLVSKRETYNDWLKRQPVKVQEEVLGIKKAKLFREGGLTVDKFVSAKGKTYTLEQLKQLEPIAFSKSGL